ncbi:activating transcription factor 3 [Drosophila sulfurigaster albostrigata]|uniref:activating transcription factor 3 n=1 Tax=Drosophila sulfurigaster albostrigata TaxID=89887 RepID=UPI002D21E1BC|nr:activating transcription factor 3 [Drosophila sulfurigaster albostrigata]
MFNSNIPATSLLSIEGSNCLGAHTPKTPEILNSVIAMTNPLDNFNFNASNSCSAASTPLVTIRNFCGNPNGQSHSQDSSHSSCSASPLDSPAGTATTPSVQQTCSQLIKAGLKLSIQSKRKLSTCDSSSGSEQPNSKCSRRDEDCEESSDEDSETKSAPKGLTPEDEDRRRRRRERNKIAATKCRMKKRERTQNLIKESEVLDTQNVELKNQVRTLETDRRRLLEMLQAHAPSCVKRGGCQLPSKLLQSPAYKYLPELELDGVGNGNGNGGNSSSSSEATGTSSAANTPTSHQQQQQQQHLQQQQQQQHMQSIPSMSTFKFGSKSPAAMAAAVAAAQQQQQQQQHHQLQQQQLPNGYCKPSPSPQEFEHAGYLSSPTQEALCLPQQQQSTMNPASSNSNTDNSSNNNNNNNSNLVVSQQVSDYVPNCEGLSLGLGLSIAITTPTNTNSSRNSNSSSNNSNNNSNNNNNGSNNNHNNNNNNNNGSSNGNIVSSSTSNVVVIPPPATTPTSSAIEFVKNELVDSQSPYTTALSAERFLFEPSEGFPDTKHAVSVHPSSLNNMTSVASLAVHSGSNHSNNSSCNNNNNHLLDFHNGLPHTGIGAIGGVGGGIIGGIMTPCYEEDQLLLMKNSCYTNDLLSHLNDDAADFVDLDTGAAAFITNGGCLA